MVFKDLSNTQTPSKVKVKRHLLTSLKVNDVTKLASHDANSKGSQAGFYFAFYNVTDAPIVFSSQ